MKDHVQNNKNEPDMNRSKLLKRAMHKWKDYLQSHDYGITQLKYLMIWIKDAFLRSSLMDLRIPMFSMPAIKWLENNISGSMRIFEWGSGASTLFFADMCSQVVSIEHNINWFELISQELRNEKNRNVTVFYIPIDPNYLITPSTGIEIEITNPSLDYQDLNECPYVKKIAAYPDHYFDYVIVDGRLRNVCMEVSISKVKTGGGIIIDDSNRERYQFTQGELFETGWKKKSIYGPLATFNLWNTFSETTIYIKM